MRHHDDYRYAAHRHLLDLEASTYQLMMLVASGDISGIIWDGALERQRRSFSSWREFSDAPVERTEASD